MTRNSGSTAWESEEFEEIITLVFDYVMASFKTNYTLHCG